MQYLYTESCSMFMERLSSFLLVDSYIVPTRLGFRMESCCQSRSSLGSIILNLSDITLHHIAVYLSILK